MLAFEAAALAKAGVDFLQVREKDLSFKQAAGLASEALSCIRAAGFATHVLLNAEWTGTDQWPAGVGLHLSASALALFAQRGPGEDVRLPAIVSASCHNMDELRVAKPFATVLLFAPVFEKRVNGQLVNEGHGLEALAKVCRAAAPVPVLAMGGVTMANAAQCLAAGARGIAGIRLFQANS